MRSVVGRFGITGAAQTLKIKVTLLIVASVMAAAICGYVDVDTPRVIAAQHLSDGLKSRVCFAEIAENHPSMLLLGTPFECVHASNPGCVSSPDVPLISRLGQCGA